jgi:hypothetical protein
MNSSSTGTFSYFSVTKNELEMLAILLLALHMNELQVTQQGKKMYNGITARAASLQLMYIFIPVSRFVSMFHTLVSFSRQWQ